MANHPSILSMRASLNCMKVMTKMSYQKDITPKKMSPPGLKVSNMLLGKSRGESPIAPG